MYPILYIQNYVYMYTYTHIYLIKLIYYIEISILKLDLFNF